MAEYIEKKGYSFPVYLTGKDHPESFHITPLPFTYVVSPDEKIVYEDHGGPKRFDHESFVEFFGSWSGGGEA